jgi:hypothetical protein
MPPASTAGPWAGIDTGAEGAAGVPAAEAEDGAKSAPRTTMTCPGVTEELGVVPLTCSLAAICAAAVAAPVP